MLGGPEGDVEAAVRFIRANASTYGLDADFIGITGYSSGGHLSAMMGPTGGVDSHSIGAHTLSLEGSLGTFSEQSSRVDAVVDWYGPTTFQAMDACAGRSSHDAADSPESPLIGGPIQENDELSALADPITYVDPTDPPFLILPGDADPQVPHCQSELLYEALHAGPHRAALLLTHTSTRNRPGSRIIRDGRRASRWTVSIYCKDMRDKWGL